ncbi:DUF6160 family protein [Marinobacter zhejiangensis]|nr:DUF6160 family protein [Marinobacter zhejiangensis]
MKTRIYPLMATSALCLPLAAHAQFQSLSDESLGSVTGQSGITIELSADLSIGELRYQDEGSLAIRNIRLGGANKSSYFGSTSWGPGTQSGTQLDNLKLNIDVMADGDLVVFAQPTLGNAVDFALSTDEWVLQKSTGGDGTRLLNSLDMTGLALDLRMKVDNDTGHLLIESTFGIDDLDADFDFVGIGIQDMKVAGMSYFESLGDWGYVGINDIGAKLALDIHTVDIAAYSNVLGIDIVRFETDIDMPIITLGDGPSIGRVTLNNLQLNNTSLVVYGH